MMKVGFKSAVSDKTLRIDEAELGVFDMHIRSKTGILGGIGLDCSTAPALALAVMEAAAPEAGDYPVGSAEYAYFEAINWLQTVIRRRDSEASEAAALAELQLEAHALLVADAHPGATVPATFAGWPTYDQARGVRLARAARSLAARALVADQ